MQDPQAAFNAEIETRLKAQSMPLNDLPEHFFDWCAQTLQHESKATLGCDMDTMKRLYDYCNSEIKAPPTLYDLGFLLNAIERRTPDQWNDGDYLEVIEAQDKLASKWNEIVTPIKEAIQRKIATQAQISRGVPNHKRIIGKA